MSPTIPASVPAPTLAIAAVASTLLTSVPPPPSRHHPPHLRPAATVPPRPSPGFGMSEKGSLLSAIAVGYLFTQVEPQ